MVAWIPAGNALNNREWATLIWVVVVAAWILSRKDIRPTALAVVRSASRPYVVVPAVALWLWTAGVVLAASRIRLWTGDLLKDTLIWSIGPALGLYWSVTKVSKDPLFFRHMAIDTLRYTVLIEFYVNLRVFSLPVELVLIPGVTFMAMLAAVAGTDAKYGPARTAIDALMSIAGLALLAFVTIILVGSWHHEDFGHDVKDLALPIWLTVGALPYLYGLSLFSGYQQAFWRIDWCKRDVKAARRAKFALVVELNGRTHLVNRLSGRWFNDLAEAPTFADAREVVRRYRAESAKGAM